MLLSVQDTKMCLASHAPTFTRISDKKISCQIHRRVQMSYDHKSPLHTHTHALTCCNSLPHVGSLRFDRVAECRTS